MRQSRMFRIVEVANAPPASVPQANGSPNEAAAQPPVTTADSVKRNPNTMIAAIFMVMVLWLPSENGQTPTPGAASAAVKRWQCKMKNRMKTQGVRCVQAPHTGAQCFALRAECARCKVAAGCPVPRACLVGCCCHRGAVDQHTALDCRSNHRH